LQLLGLASRHYAAYASHFRKESTDMAKLIAVCGQPTDKEAFNTY